MNMGMGNMIKVRAQVYESCFPMKVEATIILWALNLAKASIKRPRLTKNWFLIKQIGNHSEIKCQQQLEEWETMMLQVWNPKLKMSQGRISTTIIEHFNKWFETKF